MYLKDRNKVQEKGVVARDVEYSNPEEFQKPQPLLASEKVLQYTSNLYGSMPPICIAVPSWLLSLEKWKPNSAPPFSTAVRLPFVRQYASHS